MAQAKVPAYPGRPGAAAALSMADASGQTQSGATGTAELLQKTQAHAKDADLKAPAEKMLPVGERHLAHAEQIAGK